MSINHSLHSPWHAFVEWLEVSWGDLVPDFECNPFQARHRRCSFAVLQMLHLRPQWLDGVEIRDVSRPTQEKFDAVLGVSLLRCDSAVRCGFPWTGNFREIHAWENWQLLPFFWSSLDFLLTLISKRLDLCEPGWRHLKENSKTFQNLTNFLMITLILD